MLWKKKSYSYVVEEAKLFLCCGRREVILMLWKKRSYFYVVEEEKFILYVVEEDERSSWNKILHSQLRLSYIVLMRLL